MAVTYLVETRRFKHQRTNPQNIDQSGQPIEDQPDPDAAIQTYLNDKGDDDWALTEMIPVMASATSYQYTFVFSKEVA